MEFYFIENASRKRDPAFFRSESGISKPIPLPDAYTQPAHKFPGLDTEQSSTGVIWCTEQATEEWFSAEDLSWTNLGQGAPEVGPIPGCYEKPNTLNTDIHTREYVSTAGIKELREAVTNLYNVHYLTCKESQYTYENVCIVLGGRAGLIRIAVILRDLLSVIFLSRLYGLLGDVVAV